MRGLGSDVTVTSAGVSVGTEGVIKIIFPRVLCHLSLAIRDDNVK